MVPSDSSEETTCIPSCGRPKRGAAVRAEGVFKALALAGAVPEETSGIELTTFVNDKAGVSAAEATTAEFETTASEVTAAAAVTSPEVLESSLYQSVSYCDRRPQFSVGEDSVGAKQAATCSSRRAKVKKPSKLGLTTIVEKKSRVGNQIEQKRAEVDATTPAMRRGASARLASGRLDSHSKPEGKANSAAIDRVLQNLSGLRTGRMRTPANRAGMEDVWKVVDDVLQNLPNTSELTVDDLVGHSTLRRFRPSDKASSCGCGDSSCEEKERCPWVVALKVMPGSGASARAGEKLEMTEELTKERAGMEEALEKQGLREEKEAGARVERHAVQGDGEEPDSSDESAKLRTLPRQEMVDDTLEELDLKLEKVEMKLTNTFQKLATKIEDLRSDPNSPEEIKRREWMGKTLQAYEPLRRQKEENERRERKRKDEEQEAVCYVCGSGYHSHNDTIVFCERCCVAVHASCYNAEGVHLVDKWYCDFCQFGITKAKENLEVAVVNAEAAAAAAAAACAESDDAMQTEDGVPTPLAEEDDEADSRTTNHAEQAVKKNKTSSESPPGVLWLPGAAGDAAAVTRAIESFVCIPAPEFDPKAEVSTKEILLSFGRYGDKDALDGMTEAEEADLGKCHEDRQKGGGMSYRDGSLMNGHVSADGRNVRQCDPRSWMPWESNGAVDAAKASTEADVSMLKRNAQHATKRSWEDFCGKGKGKAKAGNAAAGAVVGSSEIKVGARNGSSVTATVRVPSASPPSKINSEGSVTAVAASTSFRSELSSCSSATVTSSKVGGSGSSSASAGGASVGKVDAGNGSSTSGNDSEDIDTATQGLLERAAALAGSVPEVAGALAALEEAEAVVGIDLPPKDKGPPDPDAVCMLCPVPRGALLRAEKGNGGVAWCHCLCALSKELLIEDRVVKLKGRIKGNGGTCSKCKKGPGGGLIPCTKDGCNAMFHPTCGQRSGGSAMRGPHLHPSAWKARCRKHAEPRPTENPGYIPATSRMPIKDMYKSSSTRIVAKTTAKAAPVDFLNLSFSSGSGSDDVIAGYKAEARVVALKSSGDLCPPGYCHRCRRKRKWTVGCALCDQFYCAFCIANLRESPFAVLKMAKAMFDAKALGLPLPEKHFTCYSCRGTCGCAGCKKAMPTDKTVKDAKDLKTRVKYSPAHSSTSTTDHLSTSTSSSTSPPRNESPVQLSRSDVPKLKAAPSAIMNDSPGWMGGPSAVSAMESVETPETAAPVVAASHSPAMHASVSSSAAQENVPKKVADNHRAAQEGLLLTPNAVDPSLHRNQYSDVEGARPHVNANTPPFDTTATRVTPPGHSPPTDVLNDVETSILKWFEAVENSVDNSMAGAARSSMNPSGGATSAPSQLHKQVGGGNPAGRECPGVRVSPKMRPASAGQPSNFISSAMAKYESPRNSSAIAAVSAPWSLPAIASSQASSNAVERSKTGIVFRDVEYTVAATNPTTSATMPTVDGARPTDSNTIANRAQTHQRSKSNVQRMQPQTKVQTLAPLRPFTQARAHPRAQGNANAHPYLFAQSNHVHTQHAVGAMVSTVVNCSSAALASMGAPRSLIVLAEKAEALRRKAISTLETARHLSQAVLDAKAFSDQNNKAAMLRVDAATKLKDKLIMANELINGYHQIRRDAEREARHAVKEKLTSISRLREAEEDARAKNPAVNADDTLTNAWWLSREIPALQLPAGAGGALSSSNGGDGCSHALPESIVRDGSNSPFRPPTGVLTNMKPSQGSRVAISVIKALRFQVRSASATAREKEATLDELVKRQNKAEDGRTELVHATQRASEAASEASQLAMHYEQEMRCKQTEESAAYRLASSADQEARTAEWEVQMMVNNLGIGRAGGFGGNGMGMANGGGGGGHVFHGVGNAATGGAASSGLFGCGGAVNNGGDGISGGGGGSGGSHTDGQGGGFTWSQYQRPGQNLDSGRRHPSNP